MCVAQVPDLCDETKSTSVQRLTFQIYFTNFSSTISASKCQQVDASEWKRKNSFSASCVNLYICYTTCVSSITRHQLYYMKCPFSFNRFF